MSFLVYSKETAAPADAWVASPRKFDTVFAALEAAYALAVRRYGQGYSVIVLPEGAKEPTFVIKT